MLILKNSAIPDSDKNGVNTPRHPHMKDIDSAPQLTG